MPARDDPQNDQTVKENQGITDIVEPPVLVVCLFRLSHPGHKMLCKYFLLPEYFCILVLHVSGVQPVNSSSSVLQGDCCIRNPLPLALPSFSVLSSLFLHSLTQQPDRGEGTSIVSCFLIQSPCMRICLKAIFKHVEVARPHRNTGLEGARRSSAAACNGGPRQIQPQPQYNA